MRGSHLTLANDLDRRRESAGGAAIGQDVPIARGVRTVRVSAGSPEDGWSVEAVDASGELTGLTWTRIRPVSGTAALTAGQDYPAAIDELSRRPVILA